MAKAKSEDELVFLPLGGSNEIGMNFNLYGYGPPHARKWIVVDLGVTFGDQTTPGVELILPDPQFIEEHAKNILGIVLTHAHEDHIGAVAWLWPRIKAPLYATPFTAFLLKEKLREKNLADEAEITIVPLGGKITLGPFELDLITLTEGSLFVIDFKTSRSRWSQQKVLEASDQLLLYGLAVQNLNPQFFAAGQPGTPGPGPLPPLPIRLHFAILTKAKSPAVQLLAVPTDAARVAGLIDSVTQVWQAMQTGHFYPNPSPQNCIPCPYRSRCPVYPSWKPGPGG